MAPLFVWFLVLMIFLWLGFILGSASKCHEEDSASSPLGPNIDAIEAMRSKVAGVLSISGHQSEGEIVSFEGRLTQPADSAVALLESGFADQAVTPIIQEGEKENVKVILLPITDSTEATEPTKWGIHFLLFALTVLTTTWVGALHAGINLLSEPGQFQVGLPYSIGLLLILGAHELGHYFTARRYQMNVTPPYFIPVPFALGTFGAFIKMRSLSPNRRALFDVAIAGPLAGLVFAIPALVIGIQQSTTVIGEASAHWMHGGGVSAGSSILMALLSKIALGPDALEIGHRIVLHPLAFAGWLGLLVTALNLLPIGQLDGGHIAHALFGGRRAHSIGVASLVALFLLAFFVWPGLMMWALIVFFIAGTRDMPPSNDVTPIGLPRRLIGYAVFVLLLAILLPVPHGLYETFGIHCPYL